jgi:hypothetical protein
MHIYAHSKFTTFRVPNHTKVIKYDKSNRCLGGILTLVSRSIEYKLSFTWTTWATRMFRNDVLQLPKRSSKFQSYTIIYLFIHVYTGFPLQLFEEWYASMPPDPPVNALQNAYCIPWAVSHLGHRRVFANIITKDKYFYCGRRELFLANRFMSSLEGYQGWPSKSRCLPFSICSNRNVKISEPEYRKSMN